MIETYKIIAGKEHAEKKNTFSQQVSEVDDIRRS